MVSCVRAHACARCVRIGVADQVKKILGTGAVEWLSGLSFLYRLGSALSLSNPYSLEPTKLPDRRRHRRTRLGGRLPRLDDPSRRVRFHFHVEHIHWLLLP